MSSKAHAIPLNSLLSCQTLSQLRFMETTLQQPQHQRQLRCLIHTESYSQRQLTNCQSAQQHRHQQHNNNTLPLSSSAVSSSYFPFRKAVALTALFGLSVATAASVETTSDLLQQAVKSQPSTSPRLQDKFLQRIAITQTDPPELPADAPKWLSRLCDECRQPSPTYIYRDISKLYKTHGSHLLFDSLLKENKIREFYYFSENKPHPPTVETESVSDWTHTGPYPALLSVFHLGSEVCGHKGVIHGGLTAALCDEVCGTVAHIYSRGQPTFTANLSINYKRPLFANSYVLVRAQVMKSERRKVLIQVSVEDGEGNHFATGTALFVRPKKSWKLAIAKFMNDMKEWRNK